MLTKAVFLFPGASKEDHLAFKLVRKPENSVCSQNKSNVILNENSKAEREKARKLGKKRLKCLINVSELLAA